MPTKIYGFLAVEPVPEGGTACFHAGGKTQKIPEGQRLKNTPQQRQKRLEPQLLAGQLVGNEALEAVARGMQKPALQHAPGKAADIRCRLFRTPEKGGKPSLLSVIIVPEGVPNVFDIMLVQRPDRLVHTDTSSAFGLCTTATAHGIKPSHTVSRTAAQPAPFKNAR